MKRPGTPLLFILSNQPSPQQKNTAPPYGLPTPPNFPALPTTYYPTRVTFSFYSQPTAAPSWRKTPPLPTPLSHSPKLSHPSHHLLPGPVDSLILLPPNQPPSQQRIPPRPTGPPRAPNFPALPPSQRPTLLLSRDRPTSTPQRKTPPRPTRPPRTPEFPRPPQHLLPNPGDFLFLFPTNRPHPSRKTPPRPTGPPHAPKLSPSQHLLPDPGDSLFLFPTNRPLPAENTAPPDASFPLTQTSLPFHHSSG